MASWIVIEGDNGTGKDTLAEQVEKLGFDILTYKAEVKFAEMTARDFQGEKRLLSFLEYNRLCGSMAMLNCGPSLLVRYWVSTVAAAYADQIWNWKVANEQALRCAADFPMPDLIVQLECELVERRSRIAKRNANSGDNISIARDWDYRWALGELRKYFPAWETIDTTFLSQEQVFQAVQAILKRRCF